MRSESKARCRKRWPNSFSLDRCQCISLELPCRLVSIRPCSSPTPSLSSRRSASRGGRRASGHRGPLPHSHTRGAKLRGPWSRPLRYSAWGALIARPALPGDQPASPGAGRYQPDCDLRSLPAAPRATPPRAGNCMATETGHRAPGRHRTGTRSSGAHRLCSRKVRPRGVAAVSRPCLCALARLLPGSSAVGGPQYRDPLCTLPECAWVTLAASSGGPALCCCPCSWTARERGEHQRLVALDRGRRTRRTGAGAATTIARRMVVLDGSLCARYDTVLRPWNGGLTVLNGVSPRY